MKLTIITLMSMLLLTGIGVAHAGPLTVAVYDFKGNGEANNYGYNVTALVTANLATETNLVLVERADLNKTLNEQAFDASGMVSSDAAAKIGQITGAKVLIAGQVIKVGNDHLILIADIVGTETSRLFADKVEGATDKLSDLATDLSQKITKTIAAQATNLVLPAVESESQRLTRILENVHGTNRPSVSVSIVRYGNSWNDPTPQNELAAVLLKAGFQIVDANSDNKPDVEIIGGDGIGALTHKGDLYSSSAYMDVKIRERRTGVIIGFEHQKSFVTCVGETEAQVAALVKVADEMAGRVLPLLAK